MEKYPEFTVEAEDLADMEDNEEREVLALIKKKGGKLCLVEVEGYKVNGGEDKEEVVEETEEEVTDDTPFDEAVMARIGKLG